MRFVRRARRAGEWRSFRNRVSVSAAATIACFQLSWTGDSSADTMRVPICTPSAPRAKAAAIVAPSTMPPAAMIGTSHPRAHERQQDHRRHRRRALEPAALAALDDEPVDAGVDRLERRGQRRHDVVHGEPGVLEDARVLRRRPGRRGHELDALVDHELGDVRVADERLGDVDAERLVGEVAHQADLVLHRVELARRRLDDPARPGRRDRRRQLAAGDPAHRRLHDRDLHPEVARDAVGKGRRKGHLGHHGHYARASCSTRASRTSRAGRLRPPCGTITSA